VNRVLAGAASGPAGLGNHPGQTVDPLAADTGKQQIGYGFIS
jgi:hypothetical protein